MKRHVLRALIAVLCVPVVGALLYVGVACVLMFFPANKMASDADTEARVVQAWVLSNGVHTDLVFPVRGYGVDWSGVFLPTDFPSVPQDAEYVAIGWGDREFFLHTPTWSDLTVSRALGALTGGNRSLLHVTYLRRRELESSSSAYRLPLSQRQYALLVEYVRATLPDGRAVPVAGAHYGKTDAFYEARGSYSVVETCNTWTGRGLRNAGVAVSWWTPFDFNVVWGLNQVAPATP